jgi:hypothetical protein
MVSPPEGSPGRSVLRRKIVPEYPEAVFAWCCTTPKLLARYVAAAFDIIGFVEP